MHYQKQTEVIWCLFSKQGMWPVSPIECNLSGALCYLISFCCPALFLSVCVLLAYVFRPCNSNQSSLILHMYEQHSGEREDCRLLFTPGHGDIISVQGQTALSLSWILLYKIGIVHVRLFLMRFLICKSLWIKASAK